MLIRLSSGDFDIANSVTLEELEEGDMSKYILPITYPLKEYSQVSVPDRYYDTLSNGMSIPLLKHSTMHNVLHSTYGFVFYRAGIHVEWPIKARYIP